MREYFERKPVWRGLLAADALFWGLGLGLRVLGGLLSGVSATACNVLNAVGVWVLLFGLALAFIKKSDLGLIIGSAGGALYCAVMIIVLAVGKSVDYGFIFDFAGYGALFAAALLSSDMMKTMAARRAQQAAMYAPFPVGGVVCASCGAVLAEGAGFCAKCGAKRPEPKTCAACNAALTDGAGFCAKCGTPVTARVKCSNCGAELADDAMFCNKCGAKTREGEHAL